MSAIVTGPACHRCPSVSRRAARAADDTSPTTSDSRPCTGYTLQVLLEHRQGHAVHARSTAVRLHPLVSIPDELLGNVVRLCLRHRLLPSRVGRSLRQECRVPSLRSHYQASSLLRTRPSLRSVSVLGSSRFRRLEVSLGIGATGSHVPHKSLSRVSRRLHAGRRSASRQASSELRPTTYWSLVSATFQRFRHVLNGSLAFVLPAHT